MQSEYSKMLSGFSLILLRGNEVIFKTAGTGISPILQLYESQPALMDGAYAVDKIVGKAAAMLFILGGVKGVHGEIMSVSAREYLQKSGVSCSCGECIEYITNREKNGMCPMEKAVLSVDEPQEAYLVLKNTLAALRKTN